MFSWITNALRAKTLASVLEPTLGGEIPVLTHTLSAGPPGKTSLERPSFQLVQL